jgi:hypothetical protein
MNEKEVVAYLNGPAVPAPRSAGAGVLCGGCGHRQADHYRARDQETFCDAGRWLRGRLVHDCPCERFEDAS